MNAQDYFDALSHTDDANWFISDHGNYHLMTRKS